MAHFLPAIFLEMFAPRPPLKYIPPTDIDKKPYPQYTGLAQYKKYFKDPKSLKPLAKHPTPEEARLIKKIKKHRRLKKRLAIHTKKYDPIKNAKVTSKPRRVLFVGKLEYSVTAEKLKREFESSKDVKNAIRKCNGKKINGRRIVCDVEKNRTIKGWKPRRLGGGSGPRKAPDTKKISNSTSENRSRAQGRYNNDARSYQSKPKQRYRTQRTYPSGGGRMDYRSDTRSRGHDYPKIREWERDSSHLSNRNDNREHGRYQFHDEKREIKSYNNHSYERKYEEGEYLGVKREYNQPSPYDRPIKRERYN